MFLSHINLMINKYTSYIIVLQYWNTAARKHPVLKGKIALIAKNVEDH
jgi:hypothetical protein